MDPIIIAALAAVAAVLLVLGIAYAITSRKHRVSTDELRERFGPEYEHALAEHTSPGSAERSLRGRIHAVEKLDIVALSAQDLTRFGNAWKRVQARFVDDPAGAVDRGHALIQEVMVKRGYPVKDFEERVGLLSVDHSNVIEHYRAARALAEGRERGASVTEDLRQAMVHLRELFADLLESDEAGARKPRLRSPALRTSGGFA